jgi:glyoxylase-like metal-dependent hydrolase (beta-lactamase superfamily II)
MLSFASPAVGCTIATNSRPVMQTVPIDPFDAPLLRNIYQITLPTPFPVGPVHTYLVLGDPLTLIDTGPQTAAAASALQAGLASYGVALSDIQRVVITHAHADHYGLVGSIVAASGAEVWAHPLAQPLIEGWTSYLAPRERFWLDLLLAAGVPAASAQRTASLYRGMQQFITHAPVAHLLNEGDVIDLAGASWQVLHCPGHADNLVCFFQADDRLLIGNDHLLAHISSNAIVGPPPLDETERRRPLVEYWTSLCRIYDMPIALVLPGHGDAVADVRGLINSRFRFYEQRLARLLHELCAGPRSVWQLAEALFRRLDAVDTFLAASEVLGHLDVMEQKGQVEREMDDAGVWLYRSTGHTSPE